MNKSAILFFIISSSISSISFSQNNWIKTGGPDGGNVVSIRSKGDTLIAGTGYDKGIIFYSTNSGLSWNRSNFKMKNRIADFVFTNDMGVIISNTYAGLYKSFDLKDWTRIYYNMNHEFYPLGRDSIGDLFAGAYNGEILCSTNNGLTWQVQYNTGGHVDIFIQFHSSILAGVKNKIIRKSPSSGWEVLYLNTINNPYFSSIAINENTIFANSLLQPLFVVSYDSGLNWENHDTSNFLTSLVLFSITYNHRLIAGYGTISNNNSLGGILISDDEGYTWRFSNVGFIYSTQVTKVFSSGNDIYAGTEKDGLYKSTDYAETWNPVPGSVTAADVRDIAIDPEGNLYAAIYGGGLSKSSDKGDTWKRINNGPFTNVNFRSIVSDNNGVIFAGSENGIFKSTDKGKSWVHTPVGNDFCYRLFRDRDNHIYAFTAGTGIYRTTDQGITWVKADTGIATQHIYSFAQDSIGVMYAGAFGSKIFRSTNNGSLWQQVYQGSLSDAVISNITVAPNGFIYAANYNEGVYRSTDHGDSWDLTKHGLTDLRVKALASDSSGKIYLSTEFEGLYESTNSGVHWNKITGNLTLTMVNAMMFSKEGTLYFATDESVWKKNDSVTSLKNEETIITNYILEQNYPNPFNPTTEIKYSIAYASQVKIKIFDILGREVKILVTEYKEPGTYIITFDASNLASGVYFYKLEAGTYTAIKKMILLR